MGKTYECACTNLLLPSVCLNIHVPDGLNGSVQFVEYSRGLITIFRQKIIMVDKEENGGQLQILEHVIKKTKLHQLMFVHLFIYLFIICGFIIITIVRFL